MPLGISTLCTFGKTFSVLDTLLEGNVQVLEILEDWDDRLNRARIEKLQELMDSRPLIFTVHSPILDMNIASSNDRFRNLSIRLVMESLEHAAELGAQLVVVHPGLHSPLEYLHPRIHWDHCRESLEKILLKGESLGVRVGVENMPSGTPCLLQKASEFLSLIEEGLPLQMTLDIGHAHTASQLNDFLDDMASTIIHVHLHDNGGTTDEHLPLGKGTVDWELVSRRLDFKRITGVVEANTLSDARESMAKAAQLFSS